MKNKALLSLALFSMPAVLGCAHPAASSTCLTVASATENAGQSSPEEVARFVRRDGVLFVARWPNMWLLANPTDQRGYVAWYVRMPPEAGQPTCNLSLRGDTEDVRIHVIQPDARAEESLCALELHRSALSELASGGRVTLSVRGHEIELTTEQRASLRTLSERLEAEVSAMPTEPQPAPATTDAPVAPPST